MGDEREASPAGFAPVSLCFRCDMPRAADRTKHILAEQYAANIFLDLRF